ncbi:IS630 family transposase, partial [Xanthomonas oryzae pv. oryzae]
VARSPLRSGEKLADRVHDQLSDIAARPEGYPDLAVFEGSQPPGF